MNLFICMTVMMFTVSLLPVYVLSRELDSSQGGTLLNFYKEETLNLHRERDAAENANPETRHRLKDSLDQRYRYIDYSKTTSRFLLELFEKLQKGKSLPEATGHSPGPLDALTADTVRCYSSTAFLSDSSNKVSFQFRVPRLPKNERILLTEFRVPIQGPNKRSRKVKITVERKGSTIRSFVLRIKPHKSEDNKFQVYDITSLLRSWVNGYHGNLTVRVQVRDKSKSDDEEGGTGQSENSDRQIGKVNELKEGLLVLYSENKGFLEKIYSSYTEQEPPRRSKQQQLQRRQRSLGESSKRRRRKNTRKWSAKKAKKSRRLCQRYDFYVDFNVIGWGRWIVFPKKFNSYLCHGLCPSPVSSKLNPSNHAMMQSLMKEKRADVAPAPCCVPSKLSPLSMLYYEEEEIVVRHHEDMIADQCACR